MCRVILRWLIRRRLRKLECHTLGSFDKYASYEIDALRFILERIQ